MTNITERTPTALKRIKHAFRQGVRKILPSSLLGRSMMILITPIFLAQVFATYMFFERHSNAIERRLTFMMASQVAVLAEEVREENSFPKEKMQTYARKFQLLVSYDADKTLDDVQPLLLEGSIGRHFENAMMELYDMDFTVYEYEDKFLRVDVAINPEEKGVLEFVIPIRRMSNTTAHIFLLWMGGGAFLLTGIAIIFMRNQIKPIKRLAWAANRFGRGLDVPHLKPSGAREVRQATEAFELMRERLQRQIEQRTTMLAGVSHDLRTPLTRIRLQLELMDDNEDVRAVKSDVDEMERMVDGYLTFVRDESGQEAELTDVSAMLNRLVEIFAKQGSTISASVEPDMKAVLRHDAIYRCISNLLGNAKKYGKTLWLKAYPVQEGIEIVIEDDGPGIPDEKKEEVFRPFYRLEQSRNPQTGGVGLGLSIAKDIIHSHGGKIILEDSNRGGLRVVVVLPV